MISFIIKVQCCWLLFFIFYFLFLRKETYFNANRFYLLLSLGLGLIIPLIPSISFYQSIAPSSNFDAILSLADRPYIEMVNTSRDTSISSINWGSIVFWVYITGSTLFLGRLMIGLAKIYRIYSSGDKVNKGDHLLVKGKNSSHAFSFFNILFIGNEYEKMDYQQIINHELGHVKGKHSLDIIFVEILNIVFWFSPIIYWYKKAIRLTHEYIADLKVISQGSKTTYGRLLISHAHSNTFADFANFIFRSPLKTRIQMMYSKRTNNIGRIKYLSILPLTLFILVFFSNNNVKAELNNLDQNFEISPIVNDTIPPVPPANPPPAPPAPPKAPKPEKVVKPPKATDAPKAPVPPKPIKENSNFQIPPPPPPPPGYISEEVFIVVEEMPRFPGCEAIGDAKERSNCSERAMLEYIYKNLKYPKEAREKGIYGKVVAQFIVMHDGSIDNITIARDIGGNCGSAVKEVLESMNSMEEKWIPGKQRGKNVNVKYTLPVSFKTEDGDHKTKQKTPTKSGTKGDTPSPSKDELEFAVMEQFEPKKVDDVIFILDGKQVDSEMEDINPDDIERIEVLKTPEAIKKYGTGTEKGVVLIYSKKQSQKEKLFVVVEQMPMFPGCEDFKGDKNKCSNGKLVAFIGENLKYPKGAKKAGIEGTVVSQFTVNAEGEIKDISIVQSLSSECDSEVLRVMETMKEMKPKWTPGKQRGKTVSVQLKLPFKFQLPKAKD